MPTIQNAVLILNGVTTNDIIKALKKSGITMEYCQDQMTEDIPDSFFFLITKTKKQTKNESLQDKRKPMKAIVHSINKND